MRRYILAIVLFFMTTQVLGISARHVIRMIDRNARGRSSFFKAEMIIKKRGRKLTKSFTGYGLKAGDKFFMRFTNQEDKGVKYLKLNKNLWIYFPDADDVLKISGHMLRKGMMGSDISYEDLLNNDDFDKKYKAQLKGTKIYKGRKCYDIVITAKVPNVTYYRQRVLVDTQKYVSYRIQMFTRSGRLIKKMTQSNVRKVGWRYIPMKIEIMDMRKKNSSTTIVYKVMRIDINVSRGIFTRRNLFR